METERTEFGVARTECACRACIANCRFMPGSLIPADLNRISEYRNEPDLTRFAFDNLLAGPGAIIFSRGNLIAFASITLAVSPLRRLKPAQGCGPRSLWGTVAVVTVRLATGDEVKSIGLKI
jgi:hypothetical protein